MSRQVEGGAGDKDIFDGVGQMSGLGDHQIVVAHGHIREGEAPGVLVARSGGRTDLGGEFLHTIHIQLDHGGAAAVMGLDGAGNRNACYVLISAHCAHVIGIPVMCRASRIMGRVIAQTACTPVSIVILRPFAHRCGRMGLHHVTVHFFQMRGEIRVADTPAAAVAAGARDRHAAAGAASALAIDFIAVVAVVDHTEAAAAVLTEVGVVFRVFDTHTVTAVASFFTAVFAKPTGVTDRRAVVAVRFTFFTDHRALFTVTAAEAGFIADTAVIAVLAPSAGGAVLAVSAFLAEAVAIAQFAVFAALGAELHAVFAALTAALADDGAVAAKRAFIAEAVCVFCAFPAHAAVAAVRIAVAGGAVTAALGADATAVRAGLAAVRTDHGTFAAQLTVLAVTAVAQRAIHTHTALNAAGIAVALRAVAAAVGTDVGTFITGHAAVVTEIHAVATKATVVTPAVRVYGTLIAGATFLADAAVCLSAFVTDAAALTEVDAVLTVFPAVRANHGAVHTAAAAGADLHTVAAVITFIAPTVALAAFLADIAVAAEIIVAVFTVFRTFRTDQRTAIAAVAAGADIIGTVIAGLTVTAEISLSANTVNAGITSAADVFIGTVRTLFITVRTDGSTVRAAVAAVADALHAVAADTAVFAPAVVAYAVFAKFAVTAEVIIAVVAVLAAVLADQRAV